MRTSRLLWGRAAARCTLCDKHLTRSAPDGRRHTVLGEEAHIVAQRPAGPRGDSTYEGDLDNYDNLTLLCRDCHKIIDDSVDEWPVDRLLKAKKNHEEEVRRRLGDDGIKITWKGDPNTRRFHVILTGAQLWDIVASAHSYQFGHPQDATEVELDHLAEVFDVLKDWGDIAGTFDSMTEIRRVQKSLSAILDDLTSRGLALVAARHPFVISGGVGPPSTWYQADIYAWRWDSLLEVLAKLAEQEAADVAPA